MARVEIEKAYTDIIVSLLREPKPKADLRDAVPERWSRQHTAALDTLEREYRVRQGEDGMLDVVRPADRKEHISEPVHEPIKTIYEKGSVPGCHDNAVFALIAWYEMVGFSWDETKDHVVDWLEKSGSWDRGGFEETTPDAVVEKKRHVFAKGYGWKQAAQEAKAVIDRRV